MKKFYFLIVLTAAFTINALSQGVIKGTVTSSEGSLPGATIVVEETKNGVVSDLNGEFKLVITEPGTINLVFSFIGYETLNKEVSVTDGKTIDLGEITLLSNQTLEEVVVEGSWRKTEANALNMQKIAIRSVNVINSDGIGKLPDRNAAEAVQRIQGVSIERDQGEGRYPAVRGLPLQWSSTTLNGDRMPTAEEQSDHRGTMLDIFPSDLIEVVEVNKSLTPDMEADALGGNINFITKVAPSKRTLNGSFGAGYHQKGQGPIYSGNLLYGDRSKNKKFGYLLNSSIWVRNWGTDNIEPRYKGTEVYRTEIRDYIGKRVTLGFNGSAEYKFNDNHKIYYRGVYGNLNDDEINYKLKVEYSKQRVSSQNIHNILNYNTYGNEVGGIHELNSTTKLDWKFSNRSAEFKYGDLPDGTDNGYYWVQFSQDMPFEGLEKGDNITIGEGGSYEWNNIPMLLTQPLSLDSMKFSSAQSSQVWIKDHDRINFSLNLEKRTNIGLTLKTGIKYRDKQRDRTSGNTTWSWTGTDPAPTMADLQTSEHPSNSDWLKEEGSPYEGQLLPVLTVDEMDKFYNNPNLTRTYEGKESSKYVGANFNLNEKSFAAYLMGTYIVNKDFVLTGGVRGVNTKVTVDGYEIQTDTEGNNTLHERTAKNDYFMLLPMLHLRYSLAKATNLKFSVTKTYSRPDYNSLNPGGFYQAHDNRFDVGNPELIPTTAWNFDLSGEHYFSNVGNIMAGVFYKQISDPIFKSVEVMDEYQGVSDVDVRQDRNGEDAWIAGFELGFNRRLDFLPGFLNGFGVSGNYTFMKSEMTIPERPDEKLSTPRQADNIFNASLYYEKGKFNTRLALNYKGAYVMTYESNAEEDGWYDKYISMDWQASYLIGKKFRVFGELNNILNAPMIYTVGNPDKGRVTQAEYYGVRGQVGLRFNL